MFGPNVHSNYKISWKKITPEQDVVLREILRTFYRLESIKSIEQVDAWEKMSNNFRIELSDGKTKIFLRKHIQHSRLEEILLMDTVLHHASRAGLLVPLPQKNQKGELVVFGSGSFWQVFPFVEGEHYRGTEKQLHTAAKNVANLNHTLSVFPEGINAPDLFPFPSIERWNAIFRRMQKEKNELARLTLEQNEIIIDRIKEAQAYRSNLPPFPEQVLHTDIHPLNLIFEGDELRAILDFGNLATGPVGSDVGKACHRLVRQFVVASGVHWQKSLREGVKIFLDAYLQTYPEIKTQMLHLPHYMADRILRDVSHCYEHYETKRWTHDEAFREISKQMSLLAETKHFSPLFEAYFAA